MKSSRSGYRADIESQAFSNTAEGFTENTCDTNCEKILTDGATVQNCTNPNINSNKVDGKTVGIIF